MAFPGREVSELIRALGEMRPSKTKIPNPEQTQMGGSGVSFPLYPMGIFFLGLFKVKVMAEGARGDTIANVNGFPSLRCPHRRLSDRLVERSAAGTFPHKATSLLNPSHFRFL